MKTINFKKRMKLLTNKQYKSCQNSNICYICKKNEDKHAKNIKYCKVRNHCHDIGEYRRAAHNICNFKFSVTEEIPIVFHNGSNYGYYFVIKELAEEFERPFNFSEENTKK